MRKNWIGVWVVMIGLIWPLTSVLAEQRAGSERSGVGQSETGRYIVVLEDAPLAMYQGRLTGLAATSPRATGARKLDSSSAAARAYRGYLNGRQNDVLAAVASAIRRSPAIDHRYFIVLNGFSAQFSHAEANRIARLSGVAFVQPERVDRLLTDAGPQWIGADALWAGMPGYPAADGAGVIVGIIDTGINPRNPSFLDPGPVDNYDFTNPLGKYVGVCDPDNPAYDPEFPCNDKLIGAWDFTSKEPGNPVGPLDVHGHGSHTASTTAGNRVHARVPVGTQVLERTISGVAPHANIIAYRGCYPDDVGGCPNSATLAATEQAVSDGVDVINYSIGGGSQDPWRDASALAFLAARNAGVFVAVSAGNSGPQAKTIGAPSNAPWVMAVGASTHDRTLLNTLHDLTSDGDSLSPIRGQGVTGDLTPSPIVYAGDFANPDAPADELPGICCTPYPPDTFTGQVVACDSGICGRLKKSTNVQAGGAGGFVLIHGEGGAASYATIIADSFVVPGTAVATDDGLNLKNWLVNNSGTQAALTGFQLESDDIWGDVMGYFSSRGPDESLMDVLKPDISAPGVNILAAGGENGEVVWQVMSGTSMASPHAAGTATLIRQSHADWTPAQIQSALMMTSQIDLVKEDGITPADPFDRGAGRVQVDQAARVGLIMDETYSNYMAADPEDMGDPSMLNIPSLACSQTVLRHTWKRTVKNSANADVTWTAGTSGGPELRLAVSPNPFSIAAGQTREITVTAQVDSEAVGQWFFGRIDFTATNQAPLHWPVVVKMALSNLEPEYQFAHVLQNGTVTIPNLQSTSAITGFTAAVFGMTPAEEYADQIYQDPTPGEPGGILTPRTGEYVIKKILARGNARLVVDVLSTSSPDLDMFIKDQTRGVTVCTSAKSGSDEYCNIDNPDAAEYWISIQNYQASDPTGQIPDTFNLAVAVVPGSASNNARVTINQAEQLPGRAVAEIAAGDRFDLDISFNLSTQTLHWYGGFVAGADPADPASIGRTNIDVMLSREASSGRGSGCFISSVK